MPASLTSRRHFLGASAALGASAWGVARAEHHAESAAASGEPLYKISVAEWSVHRAIWNGEMTNLDFPRVAREEFGIDGVEYVNSLFDGKGEDASYLADLKKRCGDHGVTSLLIMVDREGQVGAASESARVKTVENHKKWLEAAATLGCHAIRVNAGSSGTFFEQIEYAADGLRKLGEAAEPYGLSVLVENHGCYSSHGAWLSTVMELADHPAVGTLPDFGNFRIQGPGQTPARVYDNYKGVAQLMPYARAVSAKSYSFDEAGDEETLDYRRLMGLVVAWGYDGYVGIEYEGKRGLGEFDGVRATKALLERVRAELASS